MTMKKFISALLVFLLLTSVAMPVASAQALPIPAEAPETAELVIGGITAVVSGAVIIENGKQLGKT